MQYYKLKESPSLFLKVNCCPFVVEARQWVKIRVNS